MEQIIVSLSRNVHAKFGRNGYGPIRRDYHLIWNYKLVKSLLTLFAGCIASMSIDCSWPAFFAWHFSIIPVAGILATDLFTSYFK